MDLANNRLRNLLQAVLTGATVRLEGATPEGRSLVIVDAGHGPTAFRTEWVGAGWPQDVREAMERIDGDDSWPRDLLLLAGRFSPGAIELLTARDANWADETGAARIVAPGLLVIRDGSAQPPPRRGLGWSPSAAEIAELLLSQAWFEGFGTTELANRSGWSAPQVSQVLQSFDDEGWTSKYGPGRGRGAKRELVDPDGMLASWSEAMSNQSAPSREASKTFADPMGFLGDELADSLDDNVRWVLGGWGAAQEVAPFLTAVPTLQIHVHEEDFRGPLEEAMRGCGLREVNEGGRVQFFAAAPSLLARSWSRDRFPLAGTPRIYVDLKRLGPRGMEAAEHLKEEAIDPLHRRGQATRGPSEGLIVWERETKARLRHRISGSRIEAIGDRYRLGTYSATYRLRGGELAPGLPEFRGMLEEAVGRETGWPPWLVPEGSRSYEDTIEAWFEDTVFNDPPHSDFWRADPRGRLCLVRGYDEDAPSWVRPPGSTLDLTLPIWRVGECLLHARRLATRLGASRIEFMMRWEGLDGRTLIDHFEPARLAGRELYADDDAVTTEVEASPGAIEADLADLVRSLVGPLYGAFSFEAPMDLYVDELARMTNPDAR